MRWGRRAAARTRRATCSRFRPRLAGSATPAAESALLAHDGVVTAKARVPGRRAQRLACLSCRRRLLATRWYHSALQVKY